MINKIGKLALIVFLAGCTQKKVEQPMEVSDEIGINGIRVDSKHSKKSDTHKAPAKKPVQAQAKTRVWRKIGAKSEPKPADAVITTKIDGPVTSTTTVKDGTVRTTIEGRSQQTVSVEPQIPVQEAVPQPAAIQPVTTQPVEPVPQPIQPQAIQAAPVAQPTQPNTVTTVTTTTAITEPTPPLQPKN